MKYEYAFSCLQVIGLGNHFFKVYSIPSFLCFMTYSNDLLYLYILHISTFNFHKHDYNDYPYKAFLCICAVFLQDKFLVEF